MWLGMLRDGVNFVLHRNFCHVGQRNADVLVGTRHPQNSRRGRQRSDSSEYLKHDKPKEQQQLTNDQ